MEIHAHTRVHGLEFKESGILVLYINGENMYPIEVDSDLLTMTILPEDINEALTCLRRHRLSIILPFLYIHR
jgi:hypothetical protein